MSPVTTSTPAAIASHTLWYRSPSQPQTGSEGRSHRSGSGLHVPTPSTSAQLESGYSQ